MATAISVYNGALIELGERALTSISEAVESQRVITSVYTDVITDCLLQGQWNFATRTVKLDADPLIIPDFGYANVFAKPTDWLKTAAISSEENLYTPLANFYDDVNYWSADVDPIYVRYISNSASWGFDLSIWPRSFTRFVELSLALRVCERLTQNASKGERLERDVKFAKHQARSTDAMNDDQPRPRPMGSWNAARGQGVDSGLRGGWPAKIS